MLNLTLFLNQCIISDSFRDIFIFRQSMSVGLNILIRHSFMDL